MTGVCGACVAASLPECQRPWPGCHQQSRNNCARLQTRVSDKAGDQNWFAEGVPAITGSRRRRLWSLLLSFR